MPHRRGQRVRTELSVDYAPYAVIPKGSIGQIVSIEEALGEKAVNVQWLTYYAGLADWDNCTLLVAPGLESLIILTKIPCEGALCALLGAIKPADLFTSGDTIAA